VNASPAGTAADERSADLALALAMADIADEIALRHFRATDLVIETKPDLTPVTEADRGVERALRDVLSAQRPGDSVLGEEYGTAGDAHRRWVLDPIDGTKNYVRGVPVWACLIALMEGQEVTVGVVSAPALSRRWWAARGNGAFVTDPTSPEPRALRVSGVSRLGDASFSFSDAHGWSERGAGGALDSLLHHTWRQRAYGDFWSHMMVAEGLVDVSAEPYLETYDMAALVPIITEAGGRITGFDGGDALVSGSALATNGFLHDQVLALAKG